MRVYVLGFKSPLPTTVNAKNKNGIVAFGNAAPLLKAREVQGYLAHKKVPPARTLQKHMPRAIWWS